MTLTSIKTENFRNLHTQQVCFTQGINVILGSNGQGKTNLLEAVYMLSITKSMRGARDRDCVSFGQEWARVSGTAEDGENDPQTFELLITPAGRKLKLDGVEERSARDWIGRLPVVFFGPQELDAVRAGPSRRRRMLDAALCQTDPRYTRALARYKRAYEHKKSILRAVNNAAQSMAETLPEFDRQLAVHGAVITLARAAYTRKLAELAAKYHADISGGAEALSVGYKPNVEIPDGSAQTAETLLLDALETARPRDLRAGRTQTGVLHDDVALEINGREARLFASQGQSRTAAVALKLAERDILKKALGRTPILLLDDVMSELDAGRRAYLLDAGAKSVPGQCLITDCGGFTGADIGNTIYINDGRITQDG